MPDDTDDDTITAHELLGEPDDYDDWLDDLSDEEIDALDAFLTASIDEARAG